MESVIQTVLDKVLHLEPLGHPPVFDAGALKVQLPQERATNALFFPFCTGFFLMKVAETLCGHGH